MAALPKDAVIGVIGAGVMGGGIAQVAASAGHTVLLYDALPEAVTRAREMQQRWFLGWARRT